jgi:polyphosphate kinase
VSIDLVIRGICCLRPGVPGLSETVRVRSIVGRFLEHSRIFRFGGVGDRPVSYYIGSADLRRRNLDRRVEAMIPVADPDAVLRLDAILQVNLADDRKAWSLAADGTWSRIPTTAGIEAQVSLQAAALKRNAAQDELPRARSLQDRGKSAPGYQAR